MREIQTKVSKSKIRANKYQVFNIEQKVIAIL